MDVDSNGPDVKSSPVPARTPSFFGQPNGEAKEKEPSNGMSSPIPPPHAEKPVSSPPPKPAVDAEACKALGNKYFVAKDYTRAIQEYTKAVNAAPDSPIYLANRAAAYMGANRFAEALADAQTATSLDPSNVKNLNRLARIYTSLGQPSEALATLDQVSSIQTVSPQDRAPAANMKTHIDQAESAIKQGTSGSMAIHALDQAERGLGSGVEVPRRWRLLRGEAYLKMGNANALGEAQTVAMSLLRKNNKDPEALVMRGRALYGQGDNDNALKHFREALNCDPDFRDGVKWLRLVQKLDRLKEEGNVAFKAARYRQALELYGKALEVDPTNKSINAKILQNRAMASLKVSFPPPPPPPPKLPSCFSPYFTDHRTLSLPIAQRPDDRPDRLPQSRRPRPFLHQSPPHTRKIPRRIRRLASGH